MPAASQALEADAQLVCDLRRRRAGPRTQGPQGLFLQLAPIPPAPPRLLGLCPGPPPPGPSACCGLVIPGLACSPRLPSTPRAPASDSAAPVSELWAVAHGQQLSFEAPACPQKRPWGPADQCPSPPPARPELQGPSARCPHPLAPAPGEGAARLTLCQLRLWDSRGSCSCAREPPPSPSSRASRAGRQPSPILATSAARLDAALKCPACQPCRGRQLTTAVSQPGGPTEGSWALPPPCRQGQPHPWPSEPAWDTPEDRGVKDPEVTSWASGHRVSPGAMQPAGRLLVLLS